jgi:hypothetical protein
MDPPTAPVHKGGQQPVGLAGGFQPHVDIDNEPANRKVKSAIPSPFFWQSILLWLLQQELMRTYRRDLKSIHIFVSVVSRRLPRNAD